MSYVPLHLHSQYSLLDGLGSPEQIVARAKELGMTAIGLTDHGVLYGAVEFYKAAKKAGIKPIIGCEMYIAPGSRFDKRSKEDARNYHAIFLAENNTGYENLMRLVSLAHTEGYYYKPRVDFELLQQYHEGIICLSGCINSEIAEAAKNRGNDAAKIVAQKYIDVFGSDNYFFELQHHPELPEQGVLNETVIALSQEMGVPLVVTGDSHYIHPEQQEAHDALLCVGTGSQVHETERMKFDGLFHIHASEEVRTWFPHVPEAMENTQRIAERCDVTLSLGEYKIPKFNTPGNIAADVYLRQICERNFSEMPVLEKYPEARERMEYELQVIHDMGFDDYFLIVWDFVKYAKDNGMLVGPGRGSAAGSLVSYLLSITTINPLEYGLIFERFLNPERVSMPDIDIDFPPSRREEVLDYVRNTYGHECVAQIITFGTMKARAAIRDVGRVLGMSYGDVDRVAKLVPQRIGITLQEALDQDTDFANVYQSDPANKRLIDLASQLEGVTRHASTHACAVVISDEPLVKYTPLQLATKDDTATITQFHMKSIEDLGLLKMDFLGLSNLAIIETALKIIKRTHNTAIDLNSIPLDDQKTYALLSRGETTGVFQLESAGMKRYLKELKPTEFEDIVAMVSLFRPGPMDFIPDYIAGKYGKKKISYLHPILEPILQKTYGIAVYQEQVIELAQKFAGFTLGEADVLRRAIGKKIRDELEAQRDKFISGAVANGIDRNLAIQVFKFIEPFANYGFNKSHAAGYAMIAYHTAYLKANYPVEFMAALLTSDQGNSDRIAIEIEECRNMGIEVLPPSVNESLRNFTVTDTGQNIRFGLGAIKNIGDGPVQAIRDARKGAEAFSSMDDFASRVDAGCLNRKVLESLAQSGALDDLAERKLIIENIDRISLYARTRQGKAKEGQLDIFSALSDTETEVTQGLALDPCEPASKHERLMWEKELLGLYVSDHPLQEFRDILKASAVPVGDISKADEGKKRRVGGVIHSVKKIMTKKGDPMLFVGLEDLTGMIECVVFPDVYKKTAELWQEDTVILVDGTVSFKEGRTDIAASEPKILASGLEVVGTVREGHTAHVHSEVFVEKPAPAIIEDLDTGERITISAEHFSPNDPITIRVPAGLSEQQLRALKEFLVKHQGDTPCIVELLQKNGPSKKVRLPFGISHSEHVDRELALILKENHSHTPHASA